MLAIVIASCVAMMWPEIRDARRRQGKPPTPPETARKAAGETHNAAGKTHHPQTLEGVLTAQLMSGEITAAQYRTSVASLAARDDERHPLQVPPDGVPPEAI
ncbi:hypothetical protein [Mangrovihabitans endophyticus]|nr:hypothetical protein [Mangrovihabitans endophyticus]